MELEWNFGFMDLDWLHQYCKTQVDTISQHPKHFIYQYHRTDVTIFLKIEGMFLLARDRNAAPIAVSSAIAASFPSLVISHLGLDIPVVMCAQWARSIMATAVAHAVDVTAASMPQVLVCSVCINGV